MYTYIIMMSFFIIFLWEFLFPFSEIVEYCTKRNENRESDSGEMKTN